MPKLIRYKFKLYKRFELDIWGFYRNDPKFNNRVSDFLQMIYKEKFEKRRKRFKNFIYRVDIADPGRYIKRLKWKFASFQLMRLFYRGMNPSKFNFFARKSMNVDGLWVLNFLLLLESRVATILYRLNWISNILFIKQYLLHGNILINDKLVYSTNNLVGLADLVRPTPAHEPHLRLFVIERLKLNLVYFGTPRYIWVCNKFMFAFIYKQPYIKDIMFPLSMDVYRFLDLS